MYSHLQPHQVLDFVNEYATKILYKEHHSHGQFLTDLAWQQQIIADVYGMASAGDEPNAVQRYLTTSSRGTEASPTDVALEPAPAVFAADPKTVADAGPVPGKNLSMPAVDTVRRVQRRNTHNGHSTAVSGKLIWCVALGHVMHQLPLPRSPLLFHNNKKSA
jgi:hypothetical protein